jgi:hypothetical protein
MAVAKVIVGEAPLFRAEQQGYAAGPELLVDQRRTILQKLEGLLQLSIVGRGCAYNQAAVRYCAF